MTQHIYQMRTSRPNCTRSLQQRGITLIVAMVLLVVVSMIAAVTVRGSASSETISNNARSQELAWQAAEAALRFCEVGARNQHVATTTTTTLSLSEYTLTIASAPGTGVDPLWTNPSNWDSTTTGVITVPLHKLDDPAATSATTNLTRTVAKFEAIYLRPPSCLIQYAGSSAPGSRVIWVTSRGFGPEVTTASGDNPNGAEIFLQSTLDFN